MSKNCRKGQYLDPASNTDTNCLKDKYIKDEGLCKFPLQVFVFLNKYKITENKFLKKGKI